MAVLVFVLTWVAMAAGLAYLASLEADEYNSDLPRRRVTDPILDTRSRL